MSLQKPIQLLLADKLESTMFLSKLLKNNLVLYLVINNVLVSVVIIIWFLKLNHVYEIIVKVCW